MYTQQETMRHLLNLMESVGDEREEISPAAEKLNQEMARLAEQDQLDEVNWKKIAAAGAVTGAALLSNFAQASQPNPLIDMSNSAAVAASCSAILMKASTTTGADQQAIRTVLNAAQQMNSISNAEFQKLAAQGDMKGMQAARAAGNKVNQKLSSMSPNERDIMVVNAAVRCVKALQ